MSAIARDAVDFRKEFADVHGCKNQGKGGGDVRAFYKGLKKV